MGEQGLTTGVFCQQSTRIVVIDAGVIASAVYSECLHRDVAGAVLFDRTAHTLAGLVVSKWSVSKWSLALPASCFGVSGSWARILFVLIMGRMDRNVVIFITII